MIGYILGKWRSERIYYATCMHIMEYILRCYYYVISCTLDCLDKKLIWTSKPKMGGKKPKISLQQSTYMEDPF